MGSPSIKLKAGKVSDSDYAQHQGFESKDNGHIPIIDKEGNAIAMTSTVGTGMGSWRDGRRVIFECANGELFYQTNHQWQPSQNAIEAGKRPLAQQSRH
ncbi:gamma-glutamyltransferase family protein [Vibrio chagasii]|nr:gamma-glutamyltransferase family protein [Vibrio chagasii]